jgi:excisionase family DNA binding protein
MAFTPEVVSPQTPVRGAPAESLLKAEDVAKILQISVSMVYKLRREGRLPAVPVGSLWRFRPEVVRSFTSGDISQPSTPARRRRRV